MRGGWKDGKGSSFHEVGEGSAVEWEVNLQFGWGHWAVLMHCEYVGGRVLAAWKVDPLMALA